MGLKLFSDGFDSRRGPDMADPSHEDYRPTTETTPNPNRYRFAVKYIMYGKRFDLVKVHYPDCNTFDGMKLLVVKKDSVSPKMKELDPHFFEDGFIVARFVPTQKGTDLATELIG
jgi:hypothetical protein